MTDPTMLLADDGMRRQVAMFRRDIDPDRAVSDAWTVRDVAAHMVNGLDLYAGYASGEPSALASVTDVAAMNAAMLGSSGTQELGALADQIESGWSRFREAVAAQAPGAQVSWHGGAQVPVSALAGMLIGEAEVHGYDVAHAVGLPWVISADSTAQALQSLKPLLPLFLDPEAAGDFRGRFEMRIRTRPERLYLVIADGILTVEDEPGGRVDCRIAGRGHEMMLVLYGRLGPLRPALTGSMVAYGRRPWWGLKMPSYFRTP